MPQIHDSNPVMDNNFITVNCIEKKKRGRELHNFFKYVLNYFEHNVDNTMVVKADGWKGGISPPPSPLPKRSPVSSLDTSVTRLGDLLDFGPLFKAFGNN